MMACPHEVIRPDVGDPILLVDLKPAPQNVEFRGSSDKAPALGCFLNSAVEAEEQEDVAPTDALVVEMTLRYAGLAEHPPPLLPVGSVFPMSVRVEVEVGVQVDSVPSAHAAVGDSADDASDVDITVLKVFELFLVPGGNGQRKHRAVGEDGAGTAS